MRSRLTFGVAMLWLVACGAQAQVEITSFSGKGVLNWACPTNSDIYAWWSLENLEWQDAPTGTVWTNNPNFGTNQWVCSVVAWETVTVPAGVFTDCIRKTSWSGWEITARSDSIWKP